MASTPIFPVLNFPDFNTNFEQFASEVFAASQEWGFFILTGHGINNVDRMFQLSKDFFDLPMELKAAKPFNMKSIGYDGEKPTNFAASEGMNFGSPRGGLLSTDNLAAWWDFSKREELEGFKAQCETLSLAILSCFASKLGLPLNYFGAYHRPTEPGNTLKMIKYPRFDKQPINTPRLSEHTDWGSITFVFTAQAGLEVRDPKNQWYDVPIIPGGMIVNIGDALSLWTNKKLKSTMHRITWENLDSSRDRYSMAYFVNPNFESPLSISEKPQNDIDERPLTFKDYYDIRIGTTYNSVRTEDNSAKILDTSLFERVKALNVANAGALEFHEIETK